MEKHRLYIAFGVGLRLVAGLSTIIVMMMAAIGLALLTFREFHAGYNHIASVALPGLILSSQLERESSLIASNAPAIISATNQFTREATMDKISDQLHLLERLLGELRTLQANGSLDVDVGDLEIVEQKRLELVNNLQDLDRAVAQRIDLSERLNRVILQFPEINVRIHEISHNQGCARDWTDAVNEALLTAVSVTAISNQAQLKRLQQQVDDHLSEAEKSLSSCSSSPSGDAPLRAEMYPVVTAIETLFDVYHQHLTHFNLEYGILNQNRLLAQRFVTSASNLFASIRHEIDAENIQFQNTVKRHSNILLVVGCLFVGVACSILLYVYRSVIRRLHELTITMQAHVQGRHTSINTRGRDEIAEMAHALEFFVNAINNREANLHIAKEKADAANQAKSVFLANMSHELRTPLNAILGYAQLLARSPHTPEEVDYLGVIQRSGEHLLTLINQVLDLSKIEAGRITLNEKIFDLRQLLDDLHRMFFLKAHNRKLRLVFECADEAPRWVETDEVKLRQVLINLLSNAIKFTTEGGVTVRILDLGFEILDLQDAYLQAPQQKSKIKNLKFEIIDTGPGIAPEEIDAVFETFGQTETGRKAQEGTGLGLPISRRFVQLMGGDMQVTSEVGKGTVFSFHIQVGVVNESEKTAPIAAHRVIALEPGQSYYRILIVDDHRTNRQLVVKLLSTPGRSDSGSPPSCFELREAANGQEALEIWRIWKPHLIWMDMRMPLMDGYEATKKIRAAEATTVEAERLRRSEDAQSSTISNQQSQTKIIALTASSLEEERAVMLDVGCDDYLRKPFRETEMFDLLHKHLGVHFVYEENNMGTENKKQGAEQKALTPEALRMLPAGWLARIHDAAERADGDEIFLVLEEIRAEHTPLAEAIAELVNNFAFDELVELINRSHTPEEGHTA